MASEPLMKSLWKRGYAPLRTALQPHLLQARVALQHFWRQRTPREQGVLGVLALLVLVVLWVQTAEAPARRHISLLQRQLLEMHDEQARLYPLLAEWKALRAHPHPAAPASTTALEPLLRQALQSLGQERQGLTLEGEGRFVLEWKAAPFAVLADWLDQVRRSARVVVLQAHVEPTARSGEVNAHLVLKAGGAP